jgi:hypothetical protein
MTPFLAVCILIVGNLFVSSASILETKHLTLTDTTTSSTGYFTTVVYSDSTCKTVRIATLQILNSCNEYAIGFYQIITANATAVTEIVYEDSKCTLNGITTVKPLTGKCIGSVTRSISASSTFTSDTPTAIIR